MRNRLTVILALFTGLLALPAASAEPVLHHVHGLAFTPDGKSLVVPAHVGLAIYRDGHWTTAPGAPHDFMGFSVAKNAMYSSGHPAPGSPLRNPLGLMKSTDGGKSWQPLGLAGESDFHLMAVGYASGAIYVLNPEPNSRMRNAGLHVTLDEGKAWKHVAASGLPVEITSLAAHPTAAATLAVGTMKGLYLSRDYGATFRRIGGGAAVTAVTFDSDGKHLQVATETSDKLHRMAVDGGSTASSALPALERDFVIYIAENPRDAEEVAIATRRRDVYLSNDAGKTWRRIARQGQTTVASHESTFRR